MKRATNGARRSAALALAHVPERNGRIRRSPTGPLRVLVASDQRLVRDALKALTRGRGVDIVGEASDVRETSASATKLNPDLILLDLGMTGAGDQVIRDLRQQRPGSKLLILGAGSDEGTIFRALKAGARGYLSKQANGSDVMRAIQAVHRGEMWTERSLMARFFDTEVSVPTTDDEHPPAPRELTTREQQILGVLSSGATNKDIARVLSISEKTVKGHLSSIFRKLRVSHRLEAALHAIQRGLR